MSESAKETRSRKTVRYDSQVQRLADETHSLDMTVLAICEIARLSHTKAHGRRIRFLVKHCNQGRDSVQGAEPQEFKPKPGWLERQGKNAEITMAKIDEAFGSAEPAPQEPDGEAVAGSQPDWWMIRYDDAEVSPEVINGENVARKAFAARLLTWNCQLFRMVDDGKRKSNRALDSHVHDAGPIKQTNNREASAANGAGSERSNESLTRAEPAASAAPSIAEAIKESRRQMGQCVKCGEMPDECTCDPAALSAPTPERKGGAM